MYSRGFDLKILPYARAPGEGFCLSSVSVHIHASRRDRNRIVTADTRRARREAARCPQRRSRAKDEEQLIPRTKAAYMANMAPKSNASDIQPKENKIPSSGKQSRTHGGLLYECRYIHRFFFPQSLMPQRCDFLRTPPPRRRVYPLIPLPGKSVGSSQRCRGIKKGTFWEKSSTAPVRPPKNATIL